MNSLKIDLYSLQINIFAFINWIKDQVQIATAYVLPQSAYDSKYLLPTTHHA